MTKGRIATRKQEVVVSTLPEVGKIKVGEKVQKAGSNVEYPKSLDYFKATGTFANEFTKIFGDKPKKLLIAFISDNLEEVCYERYESWDRGKRFGYGDGETFTVWDETSKTYVSGVPADDARVRNLKWSVTLTLRFVLLQMKGVMGYWSFSTKGKLTTIPSIVASFDFVREKAGTIIGFPFSLLVEKKTGYSPSDPKSYPVVTLVPNFTEESIEHVAEYINQGGAVNKITTRMIEQQNVLMLEQQKPINNEISQNPEQGNS